MDGTTIAAALVAALLILFVLALFARFLTWIFSNNHKPDTTVEMAKRSVIYRIISRTGR